MSTIRTSLLLVSLLSVFPFAFGQPTDSPVLMEIKRSPCYGECPHYEMKVFKNGDITFHGKKFTEPLGLYQGEISKKDCRRLKRAFRKAKFKKMPDDLTDKNIADAAKTYLSQYRKRETKTVVGSRNSSEGFKNIVDIFEVIKEKTEWMSLAYTEEKTTIPDDVDPIRFTVQLDQNVDMSEWLRKYVRQGVVLDPSMVPNFNFLKIQFNPKLIDYVDMLQKLREDKEVTTVKSVKRKQSAKQ